MIDATDTDRWNQDAGGYTQSERDEADMQLSKADEVREMLMKAASLAARELAAVSLLNRDDPHLGRGTEEIAEAASELAEDIFLKLINERARKQCQEIVDNEP